MFVEQAAPGARFQVARAGLASSARRALLLAPGPGPPSGRRFSRFAVRRASRHRPAARARRPPGRRAAAAQLDRSSRRLPPIAAHSLRWPSAAASRSQARARSRARTLRRSFHQGRWLRKASFGAASLGRASSSWRFREPVSGKLCSRPGGDHGRLPPGIGSQEPLGSRPAAGPQRVSNQAVLRVSRRPGGPGMAGRHGEPQRLLRRCATSRGDGPPPQPPPALFHQPQDPPPRVRPAAQAASP